MSAQYQEQFAFYEALWLFYSTHKKAIQRKYRPITRKLLDFNSREMNPQAFLRPPQAEALEMYIFLKEGLDNAQIADIFDDWRKSGGIFSGRESFGRRGRVAQMGLFDMATEKQTDAVFRQMRSGEEAYPNYIFALTMGLGKTILMATCIFYEFLLANKYPKDKRFCHNALVFAPDKTVLQSLKEIATFDKSLVLPREYVAVIDNNLKLYFLEDTGTTLSTIDGSDFNLIISNDQKIITKRKHKEDSAADRLFSSASSLLSTVYGGTDTFEVGDLVPNQRFQRLCRLPQIGVYVDEAHHIFGAALKKALQDKKSETSLRATVNFLNGELTARGTGVVACYNYTGTPYVNNKVLPEVVYSYGLSKSISNGYLKSARVEGYGNVKSEEFLREVITDFWSRYGENEYEGLLPKLAIFAADLREVDQEVRPAVERVLSDLGVSTSKILVNTGDSKLTSNEDIHTFNNLDNPHAGGNDKQFIILVQKGREGWNCRSLFGVALFRSPKSKVFVLQATMRCLRQITDTQQEASVYLSKENFDILDAELNKNFNMTIEEMSSGDKPERREYQVRMVPPERKVTISKLRHHYDVEMSLPSKPVSFDLSSVDMSAYDTVRYEKSKLATDLAVTEQRIGELSEQTQYTRIMLVAEIARNLGPTVKCSQIDRLLAESEEGLAAILEAVNAHNEVLYDHIIPKLNAAIYQVTPRVESTSEEVVLLHAPKDSGFYSFKARPELVSVEYDSQFAQSHVRSFHADTYCFDSKPEKQYFLQSMFSDKVAEVYFTGMFTSGQGDLVIQYCDPETYRIRSYYPDFYVVMKDGKIKLIEVKGDNKIDDVVVQAKASAAREMAAHSAIEYEMWPGSWIEHHNVYDTSYDEMRRQILQQLSLIE